MPENKDDEETLLRATLAGLPLRPEDAQALVQGWRLIQPHLRLVMSEKLPPEAEPAALFRP